MTSGSAKLVVHNKAHHGIKGLLHQSYVQLAGYLEARKISVEVIEGKRILEVCFPYSAL